MVDEKSLTDRADLSRGVKKPSTGSSPVPKVEGSTPEANKKSSTMGRWVVKSSFGLIKNEKQADFVLVVFALLLISLSIYWGFGGGGGGGGVLNPIVPAE